MVGPRIAIVDKRKIGDPRSHAAGKVGPHEVLEAVRRREDREVRTCIINMLLNQSRHDLPFGASERGINHMQVTAPCSSARQFGGGKRYGRHGRGTAANAALPIEVSR